MTLLPKPPHVWQTKVMREYEIDNLADVLARLDVHPCRAKWSYQEQAKFILETLIAESEDGTITALFEEL